MRKTIFSRLLSLLLIFVMVMGADITVFADENALINTGHRPLTAAPGVVCTYQGFYVKPFGFDGVDNWYDYVTSSSYWGSEEVIRKHYADMVQGGIFDHSGLLCCWGSFYEDVGKPKVAVKCYENGVIDDSGTTQSGVLGFTRMGSPGSPHNPDGILNAWELRVGFDPMITAVIKDDKMTCREIGTESLKYFGSEPVLKTAIAYADSYFCGQGEEFCAKLAEEYGLRDIQIHALGMMCIWMLYSDHCLGGFNAQYLPQFAKYMNQPGAKYFTAFEMGDYIFQANCNYDGYEQAWFITKPALAAMCTGNLDPNAFTAPLYGNMPSFSGKLEDKYAKKAESICLYDMTSVAIQNHYKDVMKTPACSSVVYGTGERIMDTQIIGIDISEEIDDCLEIKAEPDGAEVKITAGRQYDVIGNVTINTPSIASMLEESTNIKLTVTIGGCDLTSEKINIASYEPVEVISPSGGSGDGKTFVFNNLSPTTASAIAKGTELIKFTSAVTAASEAPAMSGYYEATTVWDFIDPLGQPYILLVSAGPVTAAGHASMHLSGYAGHGTEEHNVHDQVSWSNKELPEKIYWEYHSHLSSNGIPNVYSQIKANECMAEDWEVLQGIPSTENLFIACGATLYTVDVGGSFESQKDITRKTEIIVKTQAPGTNSAPGGGGSVPTGTFWTVTTPCALHCDGHVVSIEGGNNFDVTATGDEDASGTCSACGETLTVAGPGYEGGGEGGDGETTGGDGSVTGGTTETPKTPKTATESHDCTWTATLKTYCNVPTAETATVSPSGADSKATLSSCEVTKVDRFNQGYDIEVSYSVTNGSETVEGTGSFVIPLIDEGYTTEKGCICSNNNNFEHAVDKEISWTFEEKIADIYYLNISQYAVYGLSGFRVTETSEPIDQGGGSSVANSFGLQVWDLTHKYGDGGTELETGPVFAGYKSGNGRLIFSSYPKLNDSLGAGWHGTTAALEDKSGLGISPANYFLGDCKVTIVIDCDDPNGAYTSDGKTDLDVRLGGGKTDSQYDNPSSTDTTWKDSGLAYGDLMTEDTWKNQAACVANMWMTRNGRGSNAGVTVVSDQMNLVPFDTSASEQSQDIVNTMYQLVLDSTKSPNLFLFGSTADSDLNGDCWCTPDNAGSVVRTINYKSPMKYTVDAAWKNKGGINYRDVFGDEDVVKMGFYGSPGGTEGKDSYIGLTGPKDSFVNGAANSLNNVSTIAGSRSGIELDNLVFTGSLRDNITGVSPYNHTELFYQNISRDTGSSGDTSFDEGYYQSYVYEGLVAGTAVVDKKGPEDVMGVSGMNNTNNSFMANAYAKGGNNKDGNIPSTNYGTPFVMSDIGISDFTQNGVYDEPVVVKAYYVNVGTRTKCEEEEIPVAPWAPNWKITGSDVIGKRFQGILPFQSSEGVKAGYGGVDTAINSVVIHDPVTAKYDYIESVGLTNPGNDDRENMHEDNYNSNGRLEKRDYFIIGDDLYVWITDYDDYYDASGTWGVGGPSNSKGTGSGGDLYSNVDKISYADLSNYYSYSGGHSHGNTTGYKNYQYMTNWVFDRYVKFPFAVTYRSVNADTTEDLVTTMVGQEIAISDCVPYRYTGMKDGVPQFTEITDSNGNIMTFEANVARDTTGPDAYLYPAEFAEAEGHNTRTHGWFFKFYVDTSALESDTTSVIFYTVAKNAGSSIVGNGVQGSDTGVNAVVSKYALSGEGENNYERNMCFAQPVVQKRVPVEVVGRIGNLTIEDTGDFRYSELFKQIPDENNWLIDGVVHYTDESMPYNVVADRLNILNKEANAETNGHATTSTTYMQGATNGKLVKTGKASPNFATLPLTPSKNNNLAFKSEAMRMGYYLYMDIDTWGNYYGINTKWQTTGTGTWTDVDGTTVTGDTSQQVTIFDDDATNERQYVTKIDIRYMLLDLRTSEYIPIDIYYGEEGNRVPVFRWDRSVVSDDFKIYTKMQDEMIRRNMTEAEKKVTLSAINLLTIERDYASQLKSNLIVSALDYTQDYIGTADELILDQKNRTFIGSSLINGAIQYNNVSGTDKWYVELYPTDAYDWNGSPLGKNVQIFGQQRSNGWNSYGYDTVGNTDRFSLDMHYNYDVGGLSEVEYGKQSQRWYFSLGLPSTSYIVPSEKAPDLYGDGDYVDYMEKYLPNHDKITAQIRLEKAHESLMKQHPHSVVVPLLKIKAQGEVFTLDYTDKEQTFKVYDEDAVTKPPTVIYEDPEDPDPNKVKKFRKPPTFEEWTIPTVFEPEVTSSDDLAVVGTH